MGIPKIANIDQSFTKKANKNVSIFKKSLPGGGLIGGIPGAPIGIPGGGLIPMGMGGGIATPPGPPGSLPALNAAVVASIKD